VKKSAPVEQDVVGAELGIINVTDERNQWHGAFDRTTVCPSETELSTASSCHLSTSALYNTCDHVNTQPLH